MRRAALAALVILCSAAVAQDRKFPTPHHQKLDALAGDWDVSVRFKSGEGFREGSATMESKWELNDTVLVQKFTSKLDGFDVTIVQMLGYDPGKNKGFELFMDNMAPGLMHNEGEFSADGRTLTHTGLRFDPLTQQSVRIKTVYTIADANHFTLDWFQGEGDKAEKIVTLKQTRKKKG